MDTLKKEIDEQDRSYKTRLASQEKRAHENWVQCRQLERRLEESKQEAGQLRQRLIELDKEKDAILAAKDSDAEVIKPKSRRSRLVTSAL